MYCAFSLMRDAFGKYGCESVRVVGPEVWSKYFWEGKPKSVSCTCMFCRRVPRADKALSHDITVHPNNHFYMVTRYELVIHRIQDFRYSITILHSLSKQNAFRITLASSPASHQSLFLECNQHAHKRPMVMSPFTLAYRST